MHPLAPDLSVLSIEELTTKYNDLVKRMLQAQRMGNGGLINQVGMLLEDYRVELAKRQQKILSDANKNANFKNIIDIN
jgi:predicted Zn-dependent protease